MFDWFLNLMWRGEWDMILIKTKSLKFPSVQDMNEFKVLESFSLRGNWLVWRLILSKQVGYFIEYLGVI